MTRYAQSAALALGIARIEARAGRAAEVSPGHLLLGLTTLCRPDLGFVVGGGELAGPLGADGWQAVRADAERLRRCFSLAGVDPDELRRALRAALVVDGGEPGSVPHRDPAARRAFSRAVELAPGGRAGAVELLCAVLESPAPRCREVFARLGVTEPLAAFFPERREGPGRTPVLDTYGRDLTRLALAGELPELIGRRAELRALARVLVRQRKPNAVLVGDAGVGKTGIVAGLAGLLAAPDAPAGLAGTRVVELPVFALLAGTRYRGDFEERMAAVLAEARENPELVLFIDELHTVLGAGGEGASDAANILKPALARGELRCIGATTPAEYRQRFESDAALRRRFEVIRVEEPSRDEAVRMLSGVRDGLAAHHGVTIAADAPAAAVDLAVRHLPSLRLPDKAIDLLDQACAAARIRTIGPGSSAGPVLVGRAEVAAVVAERAGVRASTGSVGDRRELAARLRERVIGQDAAVDVVADAIGTARAGLADPRRPVGVFLFAGPTGTGKTELATALAEALFDDERRLVRIDLSEYQERHAVSRLLGAPPGYVGHDRDGQLSGPLHDHPHSVVLFDEVEKAHPAVLDLLLQITDDGHLTDARGRRVSFTNAVVVLTSNLGTAAHPLGFAAGSAGSADRVLAALRQDLRPELLGRIGRVVVFDPLTRPALLRITDKLVDRVRARLADRRIGLTLTASAYDLLVGHGVGSPAGARALEHAVDRLLVGPLGRALLDGRLTTDTSIEVAASDGELVHRPAAPVVDHRQAAADRGSAGRE